MVDIMEPFEYQCGEKDPKGSVSTIWRNFYRAAVALNQNKIPDSPNVPCDGCTACCKDIGEVGLGPLDDPSLISEINEKGNAQIPRDPDTGHCIYLLDEKCSIYDKRPITCRIFDCRIYAITGALHGENPKNDLNITIMNWDMRKFFKTREDFIRLNAARIALHTLDSEVGGPAIGFAAHEDYLKQAGDMIRRANART